MTMREGVCPADKVSKQEAAQETTLRQARTDLNTKAARAREHEAEIAEGRKESRRQREIFEARKEEILAAHPGKHIAVCAGEVFAGDTLEEAALRARKAHGGRASYFYTRGYRLPQSLK